MSRLFTSVLVALLLVSSAASAQGPKFELFASTGYGWGQGIDFAGEEVGGQTYRSIDLGDGMYYGVGGGMYVNRNVQVAFLWDMQQSEYVLDGTAEMSISDVTIDNYHGALIYNFGSTLDKVRPIVFGGLGATYFRGFEFEDATGQSQSRGGEAKFSTTWGAGAKLLLNERFAFQVDFKWTPTYVKSEPNGYWCDPYYGCYTSADPDYAHQLKLGGTLVVRF